MDTPDELDRRIEEDYQRDKALLKGSATVRAIYALGWLKGRTAGLAAGTEYAVIGEHTNESHLDAVLEVQRQTS